MANAEHLKILKLGVEGWNEWRNKNEDVEIDLSGANLKGANLRGANLHRVALSGAKLKGADLTLANLSQADLSEARLSRARLNGAYLKGADLTRVSLDRAHLMLSYLNEANLNEAYLSGATLIQATLKGATLKGATLYATNLSETNLSGADFTGADLSFANLTEANLSRADLTGADLTEADLTGADLTEANLNEANFNEADLNGADLNGAVLYRTFFGRSDLSSCKNLESVNVLGECFIAFPTNRASKSLPKAFLTKLGLEYLSDFSLMIYPVFISHSWADKAFVRKLYDALTKQGVSTWLDEKKMKPGDNIHDSIAEGIKNYDKLVLVCSESALNSWWVEKELDRVYEKEREMQKERGKKFRLVIPIRIDDSILQCNEGIVTAVKSSMIADFTKWQEEAEFEKAVKELVDALNTGRLDIKPPSLL